MSIRRKIAKTTAIAALTLATFTGLSGTAFAGINGQKITIHDDRGDVSSVWIEGHNELGNYVHGCFTTPYYSNDLGGWWWVGTVKIYGFTNSTCNFSASHNPVWYDDPDVPKSVGYFTNTMVISDVDDSISWTG
ncbi:hypothetical protein ACVB8X_28640 [Streptomyces sp. NRAIS4]